MALTSRWTDLRPHAEQIRLSTAMLNRSCRFPVVPAGRRSGKTEIFKRVLVISAMAGTGFPKPSFFAGAPTRDQAKRIYWDDLKALTPKEYMSRDPLETELSIFYKSGSMLSVVGLDKPERIEGSPWDGGVLDEYGNMKETAWTQNVRPALSDRKGWCAFIGVPEGRNHYYDLYKKALADVTKQWDVFHWLSRDILDPDEIEAAKNDLDELTFQQEYEGSFITFEGRAYYAFNERDNTARIKYNPKAPLIICYDFNVAPGVAAIIQEKTRFDRFNQPILNDTITCVIGEVWIERNSNTILVTNKILQDWGKHQGEIYIYGDSTGGAKGSAKVAGSDWDIVEGMLNRHFGRDRVHFRVPRANPPERTRVNAVNSRCKSMNGTVRFLCDSTKAQHVIKDFEGVQVVKGGSGEIDKKENPKLTHISDAVGYYINAEFPTMGNRDGVIELVGV